MQLYYGKRAVLYYGIYESKNAIPDLEQAFEIYQTLYSLDNNNLGAYRAMGIIKMQYARSLLDLEKYQQAITETKRGIEIRQMLITLDPENTGRKREHAEGLITFAEVLYAGGQKQEACIALKNGMEEMELLKQQGRLQAYKLANYLEDDAPVMVHCNPVKQE